MFFSTLSARPKGLKRLGLDILGSYKVLVAAFAELLKMTLTWDSNESCLLWVLGGLRAGVPGVVKLMSYKASPGKWLVEGRTSIRLQGFVHPFDNRVWVIVYPKALLE